MFSLSNRYVFVLTGIIGSAALLFALLFAPIDAHARGKKIKALTDSNVRAFITKTSHMTSGQDETIPHEQLVSYLKKHLAKNVRFASKMTYHLPGMPPQETSVLLTKEEFIDTAGEGAKSVQSYDNQVEIKEVKIVSGRKAFVKTVNTETGFMAVPKADGSTSDDVPIEGKSECTQSVLLDNGVIQISNAVCTTNIHFQE